MNRTETGSEYEKLVFEALKRMHEKDGAENAVLERNARLTGNSGMSYQIDILITFFVAGIPYQVAVECKSRKSPIGHRDISAFHAMLTDISCFSGIFITDRTYARGAIQVARQFGIRLMQIKRICENDMNPAVKSVRFRNRQITVLHPLVSCIPVKSLHSDDIPTGQTDTTELIVPEDDKRQEIHLSPLDLENLILIDHAQGLWIPVRELMYPGDTPFSMAHVSMDKDLDNAEMFNRCLDKGFPIRHLHTECDIVAGELQTEDLTAKDATNLLIRDLTDDTYRILWKNRILQELPQPEALLNLPASPRQDVDLSALAPGKKIPDPQMISLILREIDPVPISDFVNMAYADREKHLVHLLALGAREKQLARLTGINIAVIERANKARLAQASPNQEKADRSRMSEK